MHARRCKLQRHIYYNMFKRTQRYTDAKEKIPETEDSGKIRKCRPMYQQNTYFY